MMRSTYYFTGMKAAGFASFENKELKAKQNKPTEHIIYIRIKFHLGWTLPLHWM